MLLLYSFPRPFLLLTIILSVPQGQAALDKPIRGFIDVLDDELGSGGRRQRPVEDDFEEPAFSSEMSKSNGIQGIGTLASNTETSSRTHSGPTTAMLIPGRSQSINAHAPTMASPPVPSLTAVESMAQLPIASSGSPFSTPANNGVAAGAYMPPGEATQWKVIGLVVICIAFVVFTSLLIVFWDTWTGFLKSILCCRRQKGCKELGEGDLIPDWEKGSWEYRLATEEGHRYPTMESLDRITRAESGRQGFGMCKMSNQGVELGVGMGSGQEILGRAGVASDQFGPQGRSLGASQSPFLDPHPLEPLSRRPSTKSTRSSRRII